MQDAKQLELRLVEYLLDSAQIVCATLTGLNNDLLRDRQFDLAVIDEAAQTTEPPCWIPILRSRRLVLAGDHCQLPPTVVSSDAKRNGFHVSLMEKLVKQFGETISRRLTTQYRMHAQIMQFSSDEFYNGELVAADSVRAHQLADLPGMEDVTLTQTAIRFFDTAGSHCAEQNEAEGSSHENPGEARRLRGLITDADVEIDTVDGFQGREKEAVVISLVRSNTKGELGFLTDTRRMNVALTRARRKLIVFGDSATLANHEFYLRLLEYFEQQDAYGTVWEIPQPDV